MVLVKDVVDRDLYFVEPSESVADVAKKMMELKIGAIVVLEHGRLRGVFSERDVLTRVVVAGRNPEKTLVAEVMTEDVATVPDCVGVEVAMDSMRVNSCRHLPVLRGQQVVGFLSMRDLMHRELARRTEELLRIRAYVHGVT
jgi:signal-transduction protein with cAMP-binding, CBS, and nucleotidyltransferase domain